MPCCCHGEAISFPSFVRRGWGRLRVKACTWVLPLLASPYKGEEVIKPVDRPIEIKGVGYEKTSIRQMDLADAGGTFKSSCGGSCPSASPTVLGFVPPRRGGPPPRPPAVPFKLPIGAPASAIRRQISNTDRSDPYPYFMPIVRTGGGSAGNGIDARS